MPVSQGLKATFLPVKPPNSKLAQLLLLEGEKIDKQNSPPQIASITLSSAHQDGAMLNSSDGGASTWHFEIHHLWSAWNWNSGIEKSGEVGAGLGTVIDKRDAVAKHEGQEGC